MPSDAPERIWIATPVEFPEGELAGLFSTEANSHFHIPYVPAADLDEVLDALHYQITGRGQEALVKDCLEILVKHGREVE